MLPTRLRTAPTLVLNHVHDCLPLARFPIFSRTLVDWKKKVGTYKIISPFNTKKDSHAKKYDKPKLKFLAQGIDLNKYTTKALPYPKTGGRDWFGHVDNKRIGGGARQKYRMVDFTRNAADEENPLVEKVLNVRYDPLRSADIALVASGKHKRWILASDKMKIGDIIKSHSNIPKLPVAPIDGHAYPVGSLPLGSVVHNIELYPTDGGTVARAAGTSGVLKSIQEESYIIKMPSGREMGIDKHCIVTAGRVSNIEYNKEHVGSAKRSRWFGIRPSSGLYKKKDGYNGRKIKPPKPVATYDMKTKQTSDMFDN